MVRQHRFAQVYGYAVCLVCVIVGLISGKGIIDDAFDLSRPNFADWQREIPATYEEFRAEQRRQVTPSPGTGMRPMVVGSDSAGGERPLSDAELRRIYESRRDDALARAKFRATKSIVGNLALFLASVLLFFGHWRWLRGVRDDAAVTA